MNSSWVADHPGLETIVRHAMAKDPRERYATAGAMASDIERALATPGPAAQPTAPGSRARGSEQTTVVLTEEAFRRAAGQGSVPAVVPRTDAHGIADPRSPATRSDDAASHGQARTLSSRKPYAALFGLALAVAVAGWTIVRIGGGRASL